MNFERFTTESNDDLKVKKLKLIFILFSVVIALILVVTIIISIIFALGESTSETENAKTYEFHWLLNTNHSVKFNMSCTMAGAPNEKCPEDLKGYEEMEERKHLTFLNEVEQGFWRSNSNSVHIMYAKGSLTFENASSLTMVHRIRRIDNYNVQNENEKEVLPYKEVDFEENWRFGVKLTQSNFVFDASMENDVTEESFQCLANWSVESEISKLPSILAVLIRRNCSYGRAQVKEQLTKIITAYNAVFGAVRINEIVTIGYDNPWFVFEINSTMQSDGDVRKYIEQFNNDEIAICKCLKDESYRTSREKELLKSQMCLKKLKIRGAVQDYFSFKFSEFNCFFG